jgi:hypothetical protein
LSIVTLSSNHKTVLQDPELEKLHAERIAALKVPGPSFCFDTYESAAFIFLLKMSPMQQKEAEKREVLKRQGHGEYREITEGDFLGEVTGSEKVICHFYHREFYRCKYAITSPFPFTCILFSFDTYYEVSLEIFARIMDKHLKALAPVYVGSKFVKLDAEVCNTVTVCYPFCYMM